MKKIIITTLSLIVNLHLYSQIGVDSIYRELKRQNVKYPELFAVLAISESGLGTYDEDTFLVKNNNFWCLGFEKGCGCYNKDGFANYNNLKSSIYDLKKRFKSTLNKMKNDNDFVGFFCLYYVGTSTTSTKGKLWVNRLLAIYNDTFFE